MGTAASPAPSPSNPPPGTLARQRCSLSPRREQANVLRLSLAGQHPLLPGGVGRVVGLEHSSEGLALSSEGLAHRPCPTDVAGLCQNDLF